MGKLIWLTALLAFASIGTGVAGASSPAADPAWVIHDLGTLGGASSEAAGINSRGDIVGNSVTESSHSHAFLWQHGKMRDLGTLGGPSSQAGGDADTGGHAINDRGEIVGSSLLANRNKQGDYTSEHAFLWKNDRLRDIGTLGGLNSRSVAINSQGLVIGESETTKKQPSGWPNTYPGKLAFVWSQGHMRRLSLGGMDSWTEAINAAGQVIGRSQLKERDSRGHTIYHAFVWQRGRIRDLGRPGTQVINDRGQIFGSTGRSWSVLEDGRVSPSGRLPLSIRSFTPTAINDRTQVAGYCTTKDYAGHPCLWEHGSVRFLGSLRGSRLGRALDINERGEIVGHLANRAFVWTNGTIHDLGTLGGSFQLRCRHQRPRRDRRLEHHQDRQASRRPLDAQTR